MELRDLLVVNTESLSAAQAKQVARDVLTKGVSGEDQGPLRTLLIASQEIATGRKIGDRDDTIRAEVLLKIKDAEARGDKRTARYLAASMAKHDMAAADIAEQKHTEAVNKFISDDIAASEDRRRSDQQQRIELRTQELLRVDGSSYGFSVKRAREQATHEIVRPRYEDDINEEPVKPNRQAILDTYKDSA